MQTLRNDVKSLIFAKHYVSSKLMICDLIYNLFLHFDYLFYSDTVTVIAIFIQQIGVLDMLIGKKVRLQPNKEQTQTFFRFAGTNRFVWNESLAFSESVYKEKGEYVTLSDMWKHLQDLKYNNPDYAWLKDVPTSITCMAMKDLLKAYYRFYKYRKAGIFDQKHPDKYRPKFKKRGKCTESFYQRIDAIHKTDNTHIKITGIKKYVKCTMLRDIELPEHIKNPRITFDGKYWYLAYSYEVSEADIVDSERETLGIDLGIKDFAILSNGHHFGNINKQPEIRRLRKRLKRLQRQVSRKYEANATTDKNGKKIFHKTNNIKELEHTIRMIYRRIRNIQKTYMYEVAKSVMRTKSQTIVIEDLNVNGMLQNPKLARSIQEENLSEFRRILTYKCKLNGTELVIADRWYPSSKTCSCCGNIKHDLKLSDRIYRCDVCGLVIDRDENAAVNLEHYIKIVSKSKTV